MTWTGWPPLCCVVVGCSLWSPWVGVFVLLWLGVVSVVSVVSVVCVICVVSVYSLCLLFGSFQSASWKLDF